MAYCGSKPGMCGHKPDCPDHNCPGRSGLFQGEDSPANARGWTKWVVIVLFAALAVVEMCLGAWAR